MNTTIALILISIALMLPPPELIQRLGISRARDGPGAYLWRRVRVDKPRTPTHKPQDLAHDLELCAACLSAGMSLAQAAAAVAEGSPLKEWGHSAHMLALGVPVERAWAHMTDIEGLEELAALAQSSARSGAALATGLGRIASQLRETAQFHTEAQAERAGVFIALPLSLCYLPAFMLLGLAPVVIGLGMNIFTTSLSP